MDKSQQLVQVALSPIKKPVCVGFTPVTEERLVEVIVSFCRTFHLTDKALNLRGWRVFSPNPVHRPIGF